jgi:hypothetical protein
MNLNEYLVALCMYGVALAAAAVLGRKVKHLWERKQLRFRFR